MFSRNREIPREDQPADEYDSLELPREASTILGWDVRNLVKLHAALLKIQATPGQLTADGLASLGEMRQVLKRVRPHGEPRPLNEVEAWMRLTEPALGGRDDGASLDPDIGLLWLEDYSVAETMDTVKTIIDRIGFRDGPETHMGEYLELRKLFDAVLISAIRKARSETAMRTPKTK